MKKIYFSIPLFIGLFLTTKLQAQNVGIGEVAPSTKLEIKGDGSDLLNVKDNSDDSKLFIKSNGNVGIGTTNPGMSLDVEGNIRTSNKFYGKIHVEDNRSTNPGPDEFDNEVFFEFKNISAIGATGSGTYGGLMTIAPWGDNSGDASHQLHFNESGLLWRQGQPNSTSWGSWQKIWNEATDGSGSGLDADLLDGQNGSYYLDNTDEQNLSNVLSQGNSAGGSTINMNGNNIVSGGGEFSIQNLSSIKDAFTVEGEMSMDNNKITSLADPTNPQDGVNLRYLSGFWEKNKFSFTVGGDQTQFYPVLLNVDGENDAPTIFTIHRSGVHQDGSWMGSFSAKITYYGSRWGNVSPSFTVDYLEGRGTNSEPLGNIADGSLSSGDEQVVLWLKGGMTYNVFTHSGFVSLDNANSGGGSVTDNSGNTRSPTSTANFTGNYLHLLDQGLTTNGSVGIGTRNPSYTLHVNGRIRSNGINETSDKRLKKDFEKLGKALDKVRQINGVYYNWRTEEFPEMEFDNDRQLGVVAQEIQKVLPEIVDEDAEGYLSVEYGHLTPLLIEAVKELSVELEKSKNEQMQIANKQQCEIDELKEKVDVLTSKAERIETIEEELTYIKNQILLNAKK